MLKVLDRSLDLKTRMFYVLAGTSIVANTLGILLNFFIFGLCPPIIISTVNLFVNIAIIIWSVKYKKINRGIGLIIGISSVFNFPILFYFSGIHAVAYFIYSLTAISFFCSQRSRRRKFTGTLLFYIIIMIAIPHFSDHYSINKAYLTCLTGFIIVSCSIFFMVCLITKQYEIQNEVLQESAKKLEESEHEAKAASSAKSEFLANMSHEIRTPINSVIGMNEIILRECDSPEIRQYALNVKSAAKTLLGLINDVLDLTKIESGKMQIITANYRLSDVIRDMINLISSKAHDKNLELKLQVNSSLPDELHGDDVRIRQIITNLLSNAVKYTETGSITFEFDGQCEGDFVDLYVCITDTGIGIRQEDMDKIFEEFQRLEEVKNRKVEGTGLGLSITNMLLRLMDSKLEVKSEYGKGSSFSFHLKQKIVGDGELGMLELSKVSKDDYSYTQLFEASKAKILVVDDNDMNRSVFKGLLKQTKVQITEAASGQECLKITAQKKFDIIFLDHMMPAMDGIETLHRLKDSSENLCQDTPIIVLTANAISGAKEMYIKQGFNDFISKPITSDRLEMLIKQYLPPELIDSTEEIENNAHIIKNCSEYLLPDIVGFNWAYAKIYLPDEKSILDNIPLYSENLIKFKALIRILSSDLDDEETLELFRIQVHSLKSTSAHVGEMLLSELAKLAEFAAKDHDIGRAQTISPILIDEIAKCEERLKNNNLYSSKPECEDFDELKKQVNSLDECMSDEIDIAADEYMKTIYGYHYCDELQPLIELLQISEENLDTESVKSYCKKIVSVIDSYLAVQKV